MPLTLMKTPFFPGQVGPNAARNFVAFSRLPQGVELVKCVAFQAEDMSDMSKTQISDIDLRVDVKPFSNNACAPPEANALFSDDDPSEDVKKMVAIRSSDFAIEGRCIRAVVTPQSVTSAGINVYIACSFSGINDDEPTPP